MSAKESIIDFSDRAAKVQFLGRLGALTGKYRVSIAAYRPRRSLKANAFMWAAVYPAFQAFMQEQGQYFEPEEIHEFMLARFASKNVIDPETGEVLAVVGKRSSKMDSSEFAEYVNHVIGWLYDRFGIVVPEPEYAPERRKVTA